ncbi:cyclic nucleotide-binding domain-containing protein [Clostridium ganghwense]|uniref:Cyclic nucleotide-binding domain-containing protein n=1 Tax=Clostridium ganghwense TaxID=312089 RepID=A0ABT4CKB5_9CLOT|nr:cyclic nucleotide-binding domain-containing protein [Clostridium ganghwense]MCY6369487.1 cyclic nucleotide-binding domain-containing protein [Clostridium ganghwense]
MLRINDENKLEYYIEKYNIEDIFEKDMKEYMELILFNKNDHICRSNEKLDYFYFLVEGKAKVYTLLKNGRSLLLQFYKPLKVIGDLEFIEGDITSSNIQVVENTLCIGIAMDNLRENAINDTKFLKYICKSLGRKLEKISKSSSINLLYPLENRLASYILAITPNRDNSSNTDGIFTYKLTEMADLLGTSYRHLTRTINKLCNQKIIKKEKDSIIILNRDLLEELACDIYE